MSYLLRDKNGTYYWRRVIPADLRAFMPPPWTGKANWKRSLRTKDPLAAKRAASRCLPECTADFDAAEAAKRGGLPSGPSAREMPSIQAIEQETLATLLSADEEVRTDGDARQQMHSLEDRAAWPDLEPVAFGRRGMPESFHMAYGEQVVMLAADYRQAFSRSDPSVVDAEVRSFMRERGIPIDATSETYYQIGMAVLRGHVRAYDAKLARQQGAIVATPERETPRGPKLSKAVDAWQAASGARGSRKISARSLQEAAYAVRRLTEWCGDIPLGDLTREHARQFRDALARVPTRIPEPLRRLPLRDLVTKDLRAYPPVHAATVNKSLNLLRAIISHAEASGQLDAVPGFRNPFGKGAKLVIDRTAEEQRRPFEAHHLKAIFATAVFTAGHRPHGGGGEAAFWLPLIGLLSGARLGELVQLRIDDLKQDPETGIWHFDIGTEGGRTIKTASSRRKVPVHPVLIEIGLLDYRASLVAAGATSSDPLWPLLTVSKTAQPGAAWSKHFNRSLRLKAGIEDPALVFHSFRHTFKKAARDAGLSEEMHDALTGHSGGGVGRSYGNGFGLRALAEAIGKIEAPSMVTGLRRSAQTGEARSAAS